MTFKPVRRPPPARVSPKSDKRNTGPSQRAGAEARNVAVAWCDAVLRHRRSLDEAMAATPADCLEPRDRALARLIVMTVLRHRGTLDALIASYIQKALPASRGRLSAILSCAAAQLVFLETPPHAPIAIAVDQCRADAGARRFDKLANAILRRISENRLGALATDDTLLLNMPGWMMSRWSAFYGPDIARDIAAASLEEAPLDLSVKSDPSGWAQRLGGIALSIGSVRLAHAGRVAALEGYDDGQWWVQDAAASLPAKLFGDVAGKAIADLCAAPGGKALQLAAAGANVTAVDVSEARLKRVGENLKRTKLKADLVAADILTWQHAPFDGVLLDAPCTATGTIRRHPDILALRRPEDIERLAALQRRLLEQAATLVRPGGTLIYCTCSLEPEEGPDQIAAFLAAAANFQRVPVTPGEAGIPAEWITAEGDVRTLPSHARTANPGLNGLDGFFVARLCRRLA